MLFHSLMYFNLEKIFVSCRLVSLQPEELVDSGEQNSLLARPARKSELDRCEFVPSVNCEACQINENTGCMVFSVRFRAVWRVEIATTEFPIINSKSVPHRAVIQQSEPKAMKQISEISWLDSLSSAQSRQKMYTSVACYNGLWSSTFLQKLFHQILLTLGSGLYLFIWLDILPNISVPQRVSLLASIRWFCAK